MRDMVAQLLDFERRIGHLEVLENTSMAGYSIVGGYLRADTAIYTRYYHLPLGSANPGASGPTWVEANANTTGGWRLSNASWKLRGQADVHADWDGEDLFAEVHFMLNVAGIKGDTVDLKLVVYYKGNGDTATKTQTIEVPTTVDGAAQYTQYSAMFTIDHDAAGNVVDAEDIISFILNLETDTSEVDDIVVTGMEFFYATTHLGIEFMGDA